MTFANFVRDDEADAFLETTASHFERSLAGDVVSPVRTSKQAWCQPGIASECYKHPLVRRLHERVANVTSVPLENAEFYQVLRYEPGQFYKQHHDQNSGWFTRKACGSTPFSCTSPRHQGAAARASSTST